MTQSKTSYHLPEISILRIKGSNTDKDSREGVMMPLSVMDKVTRVRNNMHQTQLRQAKQKLHNEINQTMKMYSNEKNQLLKQLANLRHDLTDLKLPEIASHTQDPYQTPRVDPKQYITETKKSLNRRKMFTSSKKPLVKCDIETSDYESDFEKSISDTEHYLFCDDIDEEILNSTSEDDQSVLNLPSISLGNTQWYSGRNLRHSSLDSATKSQTMEFEPDTVYSSETSQKQISVLSVHDSQRCEIKLPTIRGINKKKVKFDGKPLVKLIPTEEIKQMRADKMGKNSQQKKESLEKLPSVEGWKIKKAARGSMRGRSSPTGTYLPPIKQNKKKRTMEVIPETLTESAEWKALYLNIHDPEKRQKTLSDILHAVRIRMHHNQNSLKFGERKSPEKDNSLCDYLLNSQRNQSMKEKVRRSNIPSHAAERCFRRSNAFQLQNYLHKRSRQRRMIEHMAGEEYRLAHIVGHKHLQDALPM